ncbi:MAG: nuclear transport factor 2 family protein [Saprospiraceae bacterium]|nr:nuclear transport factor 2 family protein [Saprospiraceae bacterium]
MKVLKSRQTRAIISDWFSRWGEGDYHNLPISEDFRHTSPFGTIEGKQAYLDLVKANEDKFLGYHFEIHDSIFEEDRACVRYTAVQGDFRLDVSEWHYLRDGLIGEIIAYYHIGEIREERELERPDA